MYLIGFGDGGDGDGQVQLHKQSFEIFRNFAVLVSHQHFFALSSRAAAVFLQMPEWQKRQVILFLLCYRTGSYQVLASVKKKEETRDETKRGARSERLY